MDMSDTENKPKTSPVQRKKPETDAEALEKKEFLKIYNQVYPAYANFATACEKTFMPKKPAKAPRTAGRGEAGTGAVEKHLDRAIISAESWSDRDKLYRRMAAESYRINRWFMKNGDCKQAAKWMNLALRFLRLSMDPKAKQDMENIQKELAEVKAAMQQQETDKKYGGAVDEAE